MRRDEGALAYDLERLYSSERSLTAPGASKQHAVECSSVLSKSWQAFALREVLDSDWLRAVHANAKSVIQCKKCNTSANYTS